MYWVCLVPGHPPFISHYRYHASHSSTPHYLPVQKIAVVLRSLRYINNGSLKFLLQGKAISLNLILVFQCTLGGRLESGHICEASMYIDYNVSQA